MAFQMLEYKRAIGSKRQSHTCWSRTSPQPTPTAMLEDALLDLSNHDSHSSSSTRSSAQARTLVAADKNGRVRRGVELDPLCVDVVVRRYEAVTQTTRRLLVDTGEAFGPTGRA